MASDRAPKPPAAPAGTGPAGRRLWRAVVEEFDVAGRYLELLRALVQVADNVHDLDALVAAEGLVVASPQGPKAHPALVEGRAQRALLARLIGALDLPDDEDRADGRRRGKPRKPYMLRPVS